MHYTIDQYIHSVPVTVWNETGDKIVTTRALVYVGSKGPCTATLTGDSKTFHDLIGYITRNPLHDNYREILKFKTVSVNGIELNDVPMMNCTVGRTPEEFYEMRVTLCLPFTPEQIFTLSEGVASSMVRVYDARIFNIPQSAIDGSKRRPQGSKGSNNHYARKARKKERI